MAGRIKYIVAHPQSNEGAEHLTVVKGGKRPAFATWVQYTEAQPHPDRGAIGWTHIGFTFQADKMMAQAKALPEFRAAGMNVKVTQVLPASI